MGLRLFQFIAILMLLQGLCAEVRAENGTCGDGICARSEDTAGNCSVDCCPVTSGANANSSPAHNSSANNCGTIGVGICGDGVCSIAEGKQSCGSDCGDGSGDTFQLDANLPPLGDAKTGNLTLMHPGAPKNIKATCRNSENGLTACEIDTADLTTGEKAGFRPDPSDSSKPAKISVLSIQNFVTVITPYAISDSSPWFLLNPVLSLASACPTQDYIKLNWFKQQFGDVNPQLDNKAVYGVATFDRGQEKNGRAVMLGKQWDINHHLVQKDPGNLNGVCDYATGIATSTGARAGDVIWTKQGMGLHYKKGRDLSVFVPAVNLTNLGFAEKFAEEQTYVGIVFDGPSSVPTSVVEVSSSMTGDKFKAWVYSDPFANDGNGTVDSDPNKPAAYVIKIDLDKLDTPSDGLVPATVTVRAGTGTPGTLGAVIGVKEMPGICAPSFNEEDGSLIPCTFRSGQNEKYPLTILMTSPRVTPAKPTGLEARPGYRNHTIDVAWNDASVGEKFFELAVSTDDTNYTVLGNLSGGNPGATLFTYGLNETLDPAVTYSFRLQAVGAHDRSSGYVYTAGTPSDCAEDPCSDVPANPGPLTATEISHKQCDLQWQNNGGANHSVYASFDGGNNWETLVTLQDSLGQLPSTVNYSVDGLAAGTTYFFRIGAFNDVGGIESLSNMASCTTRPPDFQGPYNLTAKGEINQIRLDWQNVPFPNSVLDIYRSANGSFGFVRIAQDLPNNTVTFDDSSVGNGVYYYRINARTVDAPIVTTPYTNLAWASKLTPPPDWPGGFGFGSCVAAAYNDAAVDANGRVVLVGGAWRRYEADDSFGFLVSRMLPSGRTDMNFGTFGLGLGDPPSPGGVELPYIWPNMPIPTNVGQATSVVTVGNTIYAAGYDYDAPTYGNMVAAAVNQLGQPLGSASYFPGAAFDIVAHNGGLVVGGFALGGPAGQDFAVVRADGGLQPDAAFGTDGAVITDLGGYDDQIRVLAVQSNGKIVAAGSSLDSNGVSRLALTRYTTAGALDSTFGSGGIVITPVSTEGKSEAATGLAIKANGTIVVTGWAEVGESGGHSSLVAHYTSAGVLDTSFGDSGKLIASADSELRTMLLQADGKLLVAGRTQGAVSYARLNSDGTPDTSYNGGVTTWDLNGMSQEMFNSAVSDGGGNHYLVGTIFGENWGGMAGLVAKVNSFGQLDESFGYHGLILGVSGGCEVGDPPGSGDPTPTGTPESTPSASPTPYCGSLVYDKDGVCCETADVDACGVCAGNGMSCSPSGQPSSSPTAEPSSNPSPTDTPPPSPTDTPPPSPTDTPNPTPTQAPSEQPSNSPTPTPCGFGESAGCCQIDIAMCVGMGNTMDMIMCSCSTPVPSQPPSEPPNPTDTPTPTPTPYISCGSGIYDDVDGSCCETGYKDMCGRCDDDADGNPYTCTPSGSPSATPTDTPAPTPTDVPPSPTDTPAPTPTDVPPSPTDTPAPTPTDPPVDTPDPTPVDTPDPSSQPTTSSSPTEPPSCSSGVWDGWGSCCPNGSTVDGGGYCCTSGVLDGSSQCCYSGSVDMCGVCGGMNECMASPTPIDTPDPTTSANPTPTQAPSDNPTTSANPTPTQAPSDNPTTSSNPTPTQPPSDNPTTSSNPTPTQSPEPTAPPTQSPSPTPTPSPCGDIQTPTGGSGANCGPGTTVMGCCTGNGQANLCKPDGSTCGGCSEVNPGYSDAPWYGCY